MARSIQSIERAAATLRTLATSDTDLGLADITAALSLPKGTVHGILQTLRAVGFVDQDTATGRYRLSPSMGGLPRSAIDPNELRARSLNWADPLAARTGQSVWVAVLSGPDALIVHHVFRPDAAEQTLETGLRVPAHATAVGKAMLAFHPARLAVQDGPLVRFTARTTVVFDRLAAELRAVRSRGFAAEYGEYQPGVASVAAPVSSAGGFVVGAVAIRGRTDVLCDLAGRPRTPLVGHVVECARAVSREVLRSRSSL